MNMNFKCRDRHLKIIYFQKGKVFWNQLIKFYHIKPVPEKLFSKGAPYFVPVVNIPWNDCPDAHFLFAE